jgi:arylsulfatase A-like enzyme
MKSTLFGTGKGVRNVMFFYRGDRLMAVRKGPWKAHFITQGGYKKDAQEHNPPLLFNVETDPSEQFDVADKNPDIIEDIKVEVQRHKQTLG